MADAVLRIGGNTHRVVLRGGQGPRGFNGPDLIELAGPTGASVIGASGGGTVQDDLDALQDKLGEFKTFEDFGAVGDVATLGSEALGTVPKKADGTPATDDTAAIQAAIDWAYGGGAVQPRAILMTAKLFMCGKITTYPQSTIIGTGRMTSGFVCAPGTTGKWWTDNGNAAKTTMSGISWYGRGNLALTHIYDLGSNGIQYGTEGILQGLWFRDAPNAYGLKINGNVGILRDITTMSCRVPLKTNGNGNLLDNIICMQAGQGSTGAIAGGPANIIGADLAGAIVHRIEIEATVSGGLPIKQNGDVLIDGIIISSVGGSTHSHLIEVDTSVYSDWSTNGIVLPGAAPTISNGIVKIGSAYHGGTATATFSGASYKKSLNIHSGNLELKGQRRQFFALRIANNGGTIQHRIGSVSSSGAAGSGHARIVNATPSFTTTPTAADASTAFAGGGKIGNPSPSAFIFDTAAQIEADADLTAHIRFNNSTTPLTVQPYFVSKTVNGTARVRLVFEFFNASTGAAYNLTTLPSGNIIEVGFSGYLA